jgi:hypothetical protein
LTPRSGLGEEVHNEQGTLVMLVVQVLSALLTPVLAGFGLWIALQQYRLAHDKVRLELFEKRHRVFRAVVALCAQVVQDGGAKHVDALQYLRDTAGADFLFNKEVTDYIDEVYRRSVDLSLRTEQVAGGADQHHAAAVQAKWEGVTWFADQLKVARIKFRPYLSFA